MDLDAAWSPRATSWPGRRRSSSTALPCGLASLEGLAEAYRRALRVTPSGRTAASSAPTGPSTRRPPAPSGPASSRPSLAPDYAPEALAILRPRRARIIDLPPECPPTIRAMGMATSRSSAGRRRAARPDPRRPGRGPQQLAGRDQASPHARGTGRPALRLARGAAREVERHRAGQEARHGGHGRGPAVTRRQRGAGRCARPASERHCRVMASDAYFPFPDGIQIAAASRGRPPSSSPAAASATRWPSRPPIAITWRWSSPGSATSGTDRTGPMD